jgi:putative membrane protein
MQIIRTILWVLITALLVAFIAMNWTKVPVNIWPLDDGNYLHFEWPVGVIALAFFILGALPMWVVHRAGRWRLKRRIHSLENTVVASSTPAVTTLPDTGHAATPLETAVLEEEPGFHPSAERPQI